MPFIKTEEVRVRTALTWSSEVLSFTIYRKEEDDLPPYIPIAELPARVDELDPGVYAETLDGYIVPVVKRLPARIWIRFSATKLLVLNSNKIRKALSYPVYHTIRYGELYSDKPRHAFPASARLSRQEQTFCWMMAQRWDPVEIARDVFMITDEMYAKFLIKKLLKLKRIRKGIMSAFRKQVEIAGQREGDLYVNQILFTLERLNSIVRTITIRIKKEKATNNDVKILHNTLEAIQKITDKNAELLGYCDTDGNIHLPLTGKNPFQLPGDKTIMNWQYVLPENAEEVPNARETETNGKETRQEEKAAAQNE